MTVSIITGDCRDILAKLPPDTFHCCVTSPPYWGLRNYGVDGQIGLEESPEAFVEQMVSVFREVRRALRPDGTLWMNFGDSYCGSPGGSQGASGQRASRTFTARIDLKKEGRGLKPKDLVGMPWRVAFALQADGWYLRQDIIWHKPNPMPESTKDRCTKAHEYIFLLSKSPRYYFDQEAILEPCSPNTHARLAQDVEKQKGSERGYGGERHNGTMKAVSRKLGQREDGVKGHSQWWRSHEGSVEKRNKRSVWTVGSEPFAEAHFATYPPALVKPCILAGCPEGGMVLDPFFGAGTTGLVAARLGRACVGIELNPEYAAMAANRIKGEVPLFDPVERLKDVAQLYSKLGA